MAAAAIEVSVVPRAVDAGDSLALRVGKRTLHAGPDGVDDVELRLRAHPGAPPLPVHKGASGGELSRVMLALEVVLSHSDPVPTLVFDEVDAGVGGRAAVEVGRRLARLARSHQVIVVTHLPQVAAFADRHLVVDKTSGGGLTRSGVKTLQEQDRVVELARMLAGMDDDRHRPRARRGTARRRRCRQGGRRQAAQESQKRQECVILTTGTTYSETISKAPTSDGTPRINRSGGQLALFGRLHSSLPTLPFRDVSSPRPVPSTMTNHCPVHPPASAPLALAEPVAANDEVDLDEAEEFIRLFHGEHPDVGDVERRVAWVRAEVLTTGTYQHTTAELAFGARVAWRNSARCIGRLYWQSLRVRDLRAVRDADRVAAQCARHLQLATNGGKIRPVISVFAPNAPDRPAPRIWNEQLVRYAGYRRRPTACWATRATPTSPTRCATWAGAPRRSPAGSTCCRWSWRPWRRAPGSTRSTPSIVLEVPLHHPDLHWFADLGLRWHAVPAISNMRLSIGGITYPAAPFNGWYLGTEIGARNLVDADRYDMLGRRRRSRWAWTRRARQTLWRDRAAVEINRAVLHSFDAGRRHHHRPPHRGQAVPHPPGQGGEGRPELSRRLDMDRAAHLGRADTRFPPLLRHESNRTTVPPPQRAGRTSPQRCQYGVANGLTRVRLSPSRGMKFPGLTRTSRELPGVIGIARVDRRTGDLLRRVGPGDIVVFNQLDLDRRTADALVAAEVAGVVNASASISGRFPNLGPEILLSRRHPADRQRRHDRAARHQGRLPAAPARGRGLRGRARNWPRAPSRRPSRSPTR